MSKNNFYVHFENFFRGDESFIKRRLSFYLPLVETVKNQKKRKLKILDIGCGKCEFLELLLKKDVEVIGIDINAANIEICKGKKVKAVLDDAKNFLEKLPKDSVDMIFLIQVSEHLELNYLNDLFKLFKKVLKEDGIVIFEIPYLKNPLVGLSNFWLDPTHKRPLPEDFLLFLAKQSGFNYYKRFYINPFFNKSFIRLFYLRDYVESIAGDVSLIFFKRKEIYKNLEEIFQIMNLKSALSYEEALEKFSFYTDFYLNFLNKNRWLLEIKQNDLINQINSLSNEIFSLKNEIFSLQKEISILKKLNFNYKFYRIIDYVKKLLKR